MVHSNMKTTVDGVPHRVNSPRFTGSMTRRAHSFKRNNNNNNEIELQINSPRSPLVPAEGSVLKRKHHHDVSHKDQKKNCGQWVFLLFCGFCLFLGLLKICATAWWFPSAVHTTHESIKVSITPLPLLLLHTCFFSHLVLVLIPKILQALVPTQYFVAVYYCHKVFVVILYCQKIFFGVGHKNHN